MATPSGKDDSDPRQEKEPYERNPVQHWADPVQAVIQAALQLNGGSTALPPATRKPNHALDQPLGLSGLLASAAGIDAADEDDAGGAHEKQDADSSASSGDEASLGDGVGAEGDEDNDDDDDEQLSRPKAIQPPPRRLGLPSSSHSRSSSSSASSFSSSSQLSFPSAILKLPKPASNRMFLGHKAAKRTPNRKKSAPKKRVKLMTTREQDAHFVTVLAKDLEESMKDDTQFERTASGRVRRTPLATDGTLLGWQS